MTETPSIDRSGRSLRALWSAILGILLAFHAMPETRLPTAPAENLLQRITAVALPAAQFRIATPPVQLAASRFAHSHRGADSQGGDTPLAAVAPSFAAPRVAARTPWHTPGRAVAPQRTANAYQARAPPAA